MTLNGFEAFITLDKNLQFQQNLYRFPITIFVLSHFNNQYETLKELIPQVLQHIERGISPSNIVEIHP